MRSEVMFWKKLKLVATFVAKQLTWSVRALSHANKLGLTLGQT